MPEAHRADVRVGAAPNAVEQPQKILLRVRSWAWTSSPMTPGSRRPASTPPVGGAPPGPGASRPASIARVEEDEGGRRAEQRGRMWVRGGDDGEAGPRSAADEERVSVTASRPPRRARARRSAQAPLTADAMRDPQRARRARARARRSRPEERDGDEEAPRAAWRSGGSCAPRHSTLRARGAAPRARGARGAEQRRLVERAADELQPDRHAAPASRPHGTERPGSPARFAVMVKTSARYIWSGSSVFSPSWNATVGATGPAMTSHRSERLVEVAADERADLLRAQVVGVVVAGASAYVPSMMRRFGSAPKPALARLRVHLLEPARLAGAQAVPDAVVAGEVRGRLGGRDEVVGGDAVARVRQRDVDERRAERLVRGERLAHRALDPGVEPAPKYSRGTPTRSPRAPPSRPPR